MSSLLEKKVKLLSKRLKKRLKKSKTGGRAKGPSNDVDEFDLMIADRIETPDDDVPDDGEMEDARNRMLAEAREEVLEELSERIQSLVDNNEYDILSQVGLVGNDIGRMIQTIQNNGEGMTLAELIDLANSIDYILNPQYEGRPELDAPITGLTRPRDDDDDDGFDMMGRDSDYVPAFNRPRFGNGIMVSTGLGYTQMEDMNLFGIGSILK